MLILLAALLLDDPAPAPPAVTVRLVKPREQGERFLKLFEGAKAPDPAALLAGYKRAKGGDTGLGKPLDAAIAALNPAMIAELATADDATVALGWSADGRSSWNVAVPHDDGTVASFATAGVLTEGSTGPPLEGLPVDKLGPRPTATLAMKAPGGMLLGSSREALSEALHRSREPLARPTIDSGWLVRVDAKGLDRDGAPLLARRAGVGLMTMGAAGLDASLRLDGETLHAEVVARFAGTPALARATIPPEWLGAVPAERTLAAFAVALDPSPAAWNSAFGWLDAVERVDPARAKLAPLRLRLNLLASAAVVKPDVDLWPRIVGLSGHVTIDAAGKADGVLVRVHAKDESSAKRLETLTLPRIARAALGLKGDGPEPLTVRGRPLRLARQGHDVAIAWGETVLERPAAADPRPRAALGEPAQRLVAFWPGRLTTVDVPDAPPVVWVGRFEGASSVDTIRWQGLKAVVRHLVDRVPFDPPPDRATPLRGAR